jgi:hypothetical protein
MPLPKNFVIKASNKSLFDDMSDLAGSNTFNQGDFLKYDSADQTIKRIASADNDATAFLGMSRVSIVSGKLVEPYQGTDVDASVSGSGLAGPEYGHVCNVQLKAGDTLLQGGLIYPAANASSFRRVTATAGGLKAIGHYVGPTVTAGASDLEIIVELAARYPNDVQKY